MKAHEETWKADVNHGFVEDDTRNTVAETYAHPDSPIGHPSMASRTALIAAAPDMARALLEVINHAVPLPMGLDLAARAALKKAGVLP